MVQEIRTLTIVEYAEHRKGLGLTGGSHQAVRKALKNHRIKTGDDGKLNPVMCDADWIANTSPGRRASGLAGGQGAQVARGKIPAPRAPRDSHLRGAGGGSGKNETPLDGVDPETGMPTYNVSRARREFFEAARAEVEFKKADGALVDAQGVKEEAAKVARIVKDGLLALPDRLSEELAAMNEPHAIFVKLRDEISTALEAAAEQIAGEQQETGSEGNAAT